MIFPLVGDIKRVEEEQKIRRLSSDYKPDQRQRGVAVGTAKLIQN